MGRVKVMRGFPAPSVNDQNSAPAAVADCRLPSHQMLPAAHLAQQHADEEVDRISAPRSDFCLALSSDDGLLHRALPAFSARRALEITAR